MIHDEKCLKVKEKLNFVVKIFVLLLRHIREFFNVEIIFYQFLLT